MRIEAWAFLTLGFLMGYVVHKAIHDEETRRMRSPSPDRPLIQPPILLGV
jgi:hypothetical protein